MIRVHLKIIGQVQGVFFRRTAKLEAEKLGVVGWVRNDPDGSVEIMAQGEGKNVNAFIKWCQVGPPFAKVEKVKIEKQKGTEDFMDFSVRD